MHLVQNAETCDAKEFRCVIFQLVTNVLYFHICAMRILLWCSYKEYINDVALSKLQAVTAPFHLHKACDRITNA